MLTIAEKVRILLGRKNMTISVLAQLLGQSRQNINNKLNRNNFTETEARQIADVLGCDFDAIFTDRDTNETL